MPRKNGHLQKKQNSITIFIIYLCNFAKQMVVHTMVKTTFYLKL